MWDKDLVVEVEVGVLVAASMADYDEQLEKTLDRTVGTDMKQKPVVHMASVGSSTSTIFEVAVAADAEEGKIPQVGVRCQNNSFRLLMGDQIRWAMVLAPKPERRTDMVERTEQC